MASIENRISLAMQQTQSAAARPPHALNGRPATSTAPNLAPLLVGAKDAAVLLGISRAQFWKLHASGKVPLPVYLGTKAPRWRVEELRSWLSAGCPDRQNWQRMRCT
jgi:predicted DNA-binding transcriptional regulator AlpA